MLQSKISHILCAALRNLEFAEEFTFKIDIPPRKDLGDYATNVAIVLGVKTSRKPFELAKIIGQKIADLDEEKVFSRVNVIPSGFINFILSDQFLQNSLPTVIKEGQNWGRANIGQGKKILLEFVSANPTGPLHVGHGRWAVVGDCIAKMLEASGYQVEKEYYVNNVGNQIDLLIRSVEALCEGKEVPEGGYGGAYVAEIAEKIKNHPDQSVGTKIKNKEFILNLIISEQKKTLESLGIKFDRWFYESELHEKNQVKMAVERLHELRKTFEEDGAIWFKSQELGDDKNRVLIREDGTPTYFAADIAYHLNKFARGYDHLINIWGTDHHGYVNRLRAAMKALGQPVEKLEIIIGQLVTLYRGGEPVRMSKRTGEMITLQEVLDEIGPDATRFFFSSTDVNTHLNFDLELAKKKSHENPVFYVQYAHARICSILRKAVGEERTNDLSELTHPAERELMLKILRWPEVVVSSAQLRHPHRLTEYGKELATLFHNFYESCRVLGNPARLTLVEAARITLRNVLKLLGVTAPESM